jgi:hypothetical protein
MHAVAGVERWTVTLSRLRRIKHIGTGWALGLSLPGSADGLDWVVWKTEEGAGWAGDSVLAQGQLRK